MWWYRRVQGSAHITNNCSREVDLELSLVDCVDQETRFLETVAIMPSKESSVSTNMELLLGSRSSNFLSIQPLSRSYPDATDYWDGNWLQTEVQVHAGTFSGKVQAELRADDFQSFRL